MNARNFILLTLASYLSIFGMLLVIFDIKRFFKTEVIIVTLLILYAITALSKVIRNKTTAYASSTLLFSALLLNTITLKYIADMNASVFAIMLIAGLFGLFISMRKCSACTECVCADYESQPIIRDVPKYIPEIYDIGKRDTVSAKKTSKKTAKKVTKRKTAKKAAPKKTAKRTTKKAVKKTQKKN